MCIELLLTNSARVHHSWCIEYEINLNVELLMPMKILSHILIKMNILSPIFMTTKYIHILVQCLNNC